MSELNTAQQESQATRRHLQRRLALARWQFAGAAVTLPNPNALIPATAARPVGQHSPGLVKLAQALERMTGGRSAAQRQLAALKAEQGVKKGVANLRQDGTAGDAFSAAVRVCFRTHSICSQPFDFWLFASRCGAHVLVFALSTVVLVSPCGLPQLLIKTWQLLLQAK